MPVPLIPAGLTAPANSGVSELRHKRLAGLGKTVWMVVDAQSRLLLDPAPCLAELTGLKLTEVAKLGPFQVLAPETVEAATAIWTDLAARGHTRREAMKLKLPTGEWRLFDLNAEAFEESPGRHILLFHWREVCVQSSTAELIEQHREQAREDAVSASAAKDRFLASLSHELRTPLNPALLLASENAANESFPPEIRRDFDSIRKHIELEVHLIDDILDLTRVSQGKLALQMQPVDLHAIIREALTIVRAEMQDKRLMIAVQLEATAHWVMGDAVRLQQVFWNLFRNAAKFTPAAGRIVVTSRRSPDGTRWAGTIEDTGIGLTADEISRIFDAFAQGRHAGSGMSSKFGGLGLGLTISQGLVKAHGGEIRVASKGRDCGATFTIELPVVNPGRPGRAGSHPPTAANHTAGARGTPEHPAGRRVLVVEDHAGSRIALTALLRGRGYEVTSASCHAEAVECAAAAPFDLLISDIGLPDRDGYELMRELHGRYGLPGIALTGYGMEDDLVRSGAAGFSSHLTKPITARALDTALSRFHAGASKTKPNP